MRHTTATLLATTLSLVSAASAHATIQHGTISGTITTSGVLAPVHTGGTLSGTYAYDDAVTQTDIYGPANPLTALTLQFSGTSTVLTLSDFEGFFGPTPTRYLNYSTPSTDALGFYFQFSSLGTFVGNTVVQQSSNFAAHPATFDVGTGNPDYSFSFNYTATPSAVPEANGVLLMGGLLGGGGLLLRRSRRNKAVPAV